MLVIYKQWDDYYKIHCAYLKLRHSMKGQIFLPKFETSFVRYLIISHGRRKMVEEWATLRRRKNTL
jgi:hypothetical protein